MTDHHAHITQLWREAAQKFAGIQPTRVPLEPMPRDFIDVKDDLRVMWTALDPLILAYGEMLVANGMDKRNLTYFRDQVRGALEGNATFCADEMAEQLAEDMAENAA